MRPDMTMISLMEIAQINPKSSIGFIMVSRTLTKLNINETIPMMNKRKPISISRERFRFSILLLGLFELNYLTKSVMLS
jgi:hypothetical protein